MAQSDLHPTYRDLSLVLETQTAIKYLRLGLANIQRISAKNSFYHPIFLFLSGGIERLLKIMLCLNFQKQEGFLPSMKELLQNKNGHDIVFLKERLGLIIKDDAEMVSHVDFDCIANSEIVNKICTSLSEFGKQGRYFNLDAVLGNAQDFNVQNEWDKIEKKVGIEYFGIDQYYKLVFEPRKLDFLFETTNSIIVSELEKLLRALTRVILNDKFSKNGKSLMFEVEVFSDIEDSQLGKTDYNSFELHQWVKRS